MGKKLFDALQAEETILELKKEIERERGGERESGTPGLFLSSI